MLLGDSELHDPLSLTVARSLFCDVPWVLGEGVLCRCIYWDWGSQLPFDWLCFFCGGLSLLQREVCLTSSEDYTYLWV